MGGGAVAPLQSQSLITLSLRLFKPIGLASDTVSSAGYHLIPERGASCIPEGSVFVFPSLLLLGGACASPEKWLLQYGRQVTHHRSPSCYFSSLFSMLLILAFPWAILVQTVLLPPKTQVSGCK